MALSEGCLLCITIINDGSKVTITQTPGIETELGMKKGQLFFHLVKLPCKVQ
jgi:hypothetical protein